MLHIRPMTAADLPAGLRLTRQAGWNQTEADWQRCLDLEPGGCFASEWGGALAGTTTTCVFGPVAWVAMVLVDESFRGRGIGRALMEDAIELARREGADHMDLGTGEDDVVARALYESLGFSNREGKADGPVNYFYEREL
jgi:GNAT superfamily N-acetyltransferase